MSTGEILVILVIYLLLFGAKGVPSLAQTLGKAVYQFRNATKDMQEEILKSANEIRKEASAIRLDQMDIDEPQTTKPEQIPNNTRQEDKVDANNAQEDSAE